MDHSRLANMFRVLLSLSCALYFCNADAEGRNIGGFRVFDLFRSALGKSASVAKAFKVQHNKRDLQIEYGNVPDEWTCTPSFFNTSDGCDCNCGIVDPDCATDPQPIGCPFSDVCESDGSCGPSPTISQCVVDAAASEAFNEQVNDCADAFGFEGSLPEFNTSVCSEEEVDKLARIQEGLQCLFNSLPSDCQDSTTDVRPLCNALIDSLEFIGNSTSVTQLKNGIEYEYEVEDVNITLSNETKQCFKELFCANAVAESSNGIVSAAVSTWGVLAAALLSVQLVTL